MTPPKNIKNLQTSSFTQNQLRNYLNLQYKTLLPQINPTHTHKPNTYIVLPPLSPIQHELSQLVLKYKLTFYMGTNKLGKSAWASTYLLYRAFNHPLELSQLGYDKMSYLYICPSSSQLTAGLHPFRTIIDKMPPQIKERIFIQIDHEKRTYLLKNGAEIKFIIITGDYDSSLEGEQSCLTIIDEADKVKNLNKYIKQMHTNSLRTQANHIIIGNNNTADNEFIQLFKQKEKEYLIAIQKNKNFTDFIATRTPLNHVTEGNMGLLTLQAYNRAKHTTLESKDFDYKYLLQDMPDMKTYFKQSFHHNLTPIHKLYTKSLITYIGIDIGLKKDHTCLSALNEYGNLIVCKLYPTPINSNTLEQLLIQDINKIFNSHNKQQLMPFIAVDCTGNGIHIADILTQAFGEYHTQPVYFTKNSKEIAFNSLVNHITARRITLPDRNCNFIDNLPTQIDKLLHEIDNFGYFKDNILQLHSKLPHHDDTIDSLLTITMAIEKNKTWKYIQTSLQQEQWNYDTPFNNLNNDGFL